MDGSACDVATGAHRCPGDLMRPTVKMSYDPGYGLCIVASGRPHACDDGDRVLAITLQPRTGTVVQHDVRCWPISDPDNLLVGG